MSSSSASKKMIVLRSSDKETFEVEESTAMQSQTIKHMIEDNCADTCIPLPNVTSHILAKVIEYCHKHAAEKEEDLKAFDSGFVKEVEQDTLMSLLMAANYLDIKGLLDLTAQTVADMMKGKSVEEIRAMFNITNDFSPEEEQELRRQNAWAFKTEHASCH